MSFIKSLVAEDNKNKFNIINNTLLESYDFSIDYSSDLNEIVSICNKIINEADSNPLFPVYREEYRKAKLIKEAVSIFLKEIAPTRRRGKRRSTKK